MPTRPTRRTRRHAPTSLVALAGRRSDAASTGVPAVEAWIADGGGPVAAGDRGTLASLIWFAFAVQLSRLRVADRDRFERVAAGDDGAVAAAVEWWAADCAVPDRDAAPATMPPLPALAMQRIATADAALAAPLARLATGVQTADQHLETTTDATNPTDRFGALYVDLLARTRRHQRGEYFTPGWLADYVLELAGHHDPATGAAQRRILDPTCGSGVFLVRALAARLQRSGAGGVREWLASDLRGTDANPLAVMTARANLALAAARVLATDDLAAIATAVTLADAMPVGDAIPQPGAVSDLVDLVVGNPPWVNWGDLPGAYRTRIVPVLEEMGLADGPGSSGSSLRQASSRAKIDIAFPILLHAARRLAPSPHARLSAVITESILQSERGARGIRANFAPGAPDAPFVTVAVADVTALSPFPATAARPAVLVLRPHSLDERDGEPDADDPWAAGETVGESAPVPAFVWRRGDDAPLPDATASLADVRDVADDGLTEQALPIGRSDPLSPWVIAPARLLPEIRERLITDESAWADRAREGINTRGANSIFWLHIRDRRAGEWQVENDTGAGRTPVPSHTAWLPTAPDGFVYPLLRGRDVRPFHLVRDDPRAILVPHDRDRPGVPLRPDVLAERSPATAAFLDHFRDPLCARRSFRNFDPGDPANPFHFAGLYNVGRYTFAPWRVVWRYIATRLEAAVIGPPVAGEPPIVADCKLIVTPCESAAEAHFVAGLLNCVPIRTVVARAFVHTQLSAHLLDRLALPAFDADDAAHQAVQQRAAALAMVPADDVDPHDESLNDAAARVLPLTIGWRDFLD